MPPRLEIVRLVPEARLPTRAYADDAGLDLHALERFELAPRTQVVARTGIAIRLPDGHVGLLAPRSGMAKRGLTHVGGPAVIDPGYRGELHVLLWNVSDEPQDVAPGDRIAQLVVVPVALVGPVEVDAIEPSSGGRGMRGLGSTGR